MTKPLSSIICLISTVAIVLGIPITSGFAENPCSLVIGDISGWSDDLVLCVVRIADAPNKVSAFGLDIKIPKALEFTGQYQPGELVEKFDHFGVNLLKENIIRVGGFALKDSISRGASGTLVHLEFKVKACESGAIDLTNLVNDIKTWPTCEGRIVCGSE